MLPLLNCYKNRNVYIGSGEVGVLLSGFCSACNLLVSCLCVSKQGLLRVAIENARAQEKQDQLERTELKMELVRERELRETLERQLSMEQKNRGRPGASASVVGRTQTLG